MANQEQDMPNRTSNTDKAEGDRKSEWGEGTSSGGIISNPPMDTPNRTSNTEKGGGERKSEWGEGTSSGGGFPSRPMADGDDTKPDTHAG